MTPEAQARQQIHAMLRVAGWVVEDYHAFDPAAGSGIAFQEVPLSFDRSNYLLLVDRHALGLVEAKNVGNPLSAVANQPPTRHPTTSVPLLGRHYWSLAAFSLPQDRQ